MLITKGFYIEMQNRSTGRIVFSAATDALTLEAFEALWKTVGHSLWNGGNKKNEIIQQFEIRVSPITVGDSQ